MTGSADRPAPETPRFGWKKTLVYSLLPALILMAVLESAARVFEYWLPPREVEFGQGFTEENRLFVTDPDNPAYMQTNPMRRQLYNGQLLFQAQRFKREKPEGQLRLFFLGGSSVNYADDAMRRMVSRLKKEHLPCGTPEIINCGGLAYGSHRLVLIAAEVLQYDPDFLLVYTGHNEFEELEQFRLSRPSEAPLQRLLSHCAVFRVIRDRIAEVQIGRLQRAHNKRILSNSIPAASRAWNITFDEHAVEERMHAFRENLEAIIAMGAAKGVQAVLGTVPSNLFAPSLTGEAGERYQNEVLPLFAAGELARGRALAQDILAHTPRHQSTDVENDIIRDLAAAHDVPLADVEKAVIAAEPRHIPGETLFNDHCHLNKRGNEIMMTQYEAIIRRFCENW